MNAETKTTLETNSKAYWLERLRKAATSVAGVNEKQLEGLADWLAANPDLD